MLERRGAVKANVIVMLIMFSIFLLQIQVVNAGPYGYGDSMNLKYELFDGKIVYGYGNMTKFATSLRPRDVNWSEWKPDSRREIVNLFEDG